MRYPTLFLATMFAACSGGDRQIAGPGDGPGTPEPRTLTVNLDLMDASLRQALGWEAGVPRAEVHILRNGTNTYQTATSDGNGQVRFVGILNGLYRVYATRRLSTSEGQAAGGDVRAFGDGATLNVGSSTTVTLELSADHLGGLVISELNSASPPPWEVGGSGYYGSQYIEVYNNSPNTIFLDGWIFGVAYYLGFRDYAHTPCATSQSVRTDPSGLMTRQALQFPGSGTQYPIEAGETRLVAMEAVDHRAAHPWLFDLSGADFEIRPSGGADNPAVPNMIHHGEAAWVSEFSALLATSSVYFISKPTDFSALSIAFRDTGGRAYVKIRAELVGDAVSFMALWPDHDLEVPPCEPMANDRFDRYELAIEEITPGTELINRSYQRQFLRREGGRPILQDTNTTAADFMLAPQTPGTIPP